jgi:hypothetical protein
MSKIVFFLIAAGVGFYIAKNVIGSDLKNKLCPTPSRAPSGMNGVY